MLSIKKAFTSILIFTFLCQGIVFAAPDSSPLRPPMQFSLTAKELIEQLKKKEEGGAADVGKKEEIAVNELIIKARSLVTTAIATTGITDLDVSLVGSLARGHLENNETIKTTDIDIYIDGKTRDPKVRKLEEMLYAIATKMNLDVDVLTHDTIFDMSHLPPEYLVFGQAEASNSQEGYIQRMLQARLEREKRIIYRAKKAYELVPKKAINTSL